MRRLIAALLLIAAPAAAQEFPARPIELVVPSPPGGGTDIITRVFAAAAERSIGQRIVVSNRAGASGALGIEHVLRQRPDGYVLASVWNGPITGRPHVAQTPYRPADMQPIVTVTTAAGVICTRADFPARTGPELVALLRANPDRYTYGNDGIGGTLHLGTERAFHALGISARSVPFQGSGDNMNAFIGGHVDIFAGSPPPILPHIREGRARCQMVTSAERDPALPEASGLRELGVPDAATDIWRAVIAPKGLPDAVLQRLVTAFQAATRDEAFIARVRELGENPSGEGPDVLMRRMTAEFEALGVVARRIGLQP